MKDLQPTCRLAVIQAAPVLFDKRKGLEKALALIERAVREYAPEVIVFPELFLPGYPYGMNFGFSVGERTEEGRAEWLRYYENSLVVPGVETAALCAAAREHGIWLSIGISERDGVTGILQGKTFGNQKVPEGWVIVTAGNPPEYNKSVREFDVVTLDRIKRIDVQPDFEVWKEYAYEQGIHPAVISYLELRRKNFYRMENTVDGRIFATARGWEDLSRLIQVYETLNKEVDREVVYQYIQHPMVAKDFASYLALYNKYKTDYAVEDLLQGKWTPITLGKIRNASLDEHLSIVGLLNGKLSQLFADCYFMDAYVTKLYGYMTEYRDNLPEMTLESIYKKAENDFHTAKKSELLTKNEEKVFIRTVNFFENEISEKATYEKAKTAFAEVADSLETQTEYISQTLQNVFDFMEAAFGDSQEMVAFITELNANYYSLWFIRENGSDQYYRHNKGLLFDNRQKQILGQMEELEQGNNFPSVLK